MKRSASLVLTELCLMLLVLALASALCLRVFVWADSRSQENAARDAALIHMQSVAEAIKAAGGVENWHIPGDGYEIRVTAEDSGVPGLGTARLEAVYEDKVLVAFSVSWQEVLP